MDKKGGVPVSIKITNQKRIPTIKKNTYPNNYLITIVINAIKYIECCEIFKFLII